MKKSLALLIAVFALPFIASAATFTVSPASGSYTAGDTVTLSIGVNPQGSSIYTAMLDARFSSDTFEVLSFTLSDALLPLKASGYDALNNQNGVLTKTGGYTGGITSSAAFGTVVLRAKKSGTATFTIADSSKLLDSNNADQQSGTQNLTYAISAPSSPQPTPSKVVTTEPAQKSPTAAVKVTKASPKEKATTTTASSTQTAAAGMSGTSLGPWLSVIFAILASFGIGYFVGNRRRIF
jgi:hypothetical protein